MIDNSGPAFPTTETSTVAFGNPIVIQHPGMTLRDYFAGQALAGMLADPSRDDEDWPTKEHFTEEAYSYADAMIEERSL